MANGSEYLKKKHIFDGSTENFVDTLIHFCITRCHYNFSVLFVLSSSQLLFRFPEKGRSLSNILEQIRNGQEDKLLGRRVDRIRILYSVYSAMEYLYDEQKNGR